MLVNSISGPSLTTMLRLVVAVGQVAGLVLDVVFSAKEYEGVRASYAGAVPVNVMVLFDVSAIKPSHVGRLVLSIPSSKLPTL